MTTREDAVRAAARHVAEGLARQDARTPRDAAIAALGRDATEAQIAAWVARFRPDAHAQPA